jgi:hypothetical protein
MTPDNNTDDDVPSDDLPFNVNFMEPTDRDFKAAPLSSFTRSGSNNLRNWRTPADTQTRNSSNG